MFLNLRTRLLVSYAFVVFLCLFLAGSAFVVLLSDYQRQLRLNQLADLAVPVSIQVRLLELAGAPPTQIAQTLREQASETGVRMLLLDRDGRVLTDTANVLVGEVLPVPRAAMQQSRPGARWGLVAARDQGNLVMISFLPRDRRERPGGVYTVTLTVPEENLTAAWRELFPSLGLAGGIALLVSIAVALLLARSIARPVAEVTRASEAMAHGKYEQSIPVRGGDELGRLARAFNAMARQVSASDRAMRDFLANVSHDLRTPLTAIQGFSQAMTDGTLRETQEFSAAGRIIHEESARMQRLVEDILYLSKLEAGQVRLERQPVDVAELFARLERRYHLLAEQRQVRLVAEGAAQANVDADLTRLEQMLSNLLDNALEHTPSGGAVSFRASPAQLDGRPAWRLEVHNSGSYLPAEEAERVFERFYQSDRARRKSGHGLGLAIVRELAQAHGGTVVVSSDPTAGTTFAVTLAARPAPSSPAAAGRGGALAARHAPSGSGAAKGGL